MGTIVRRGEKYRAVVRKKGHGTLTKTFSRHVLAKRWVAKTELELEEKRLSGQHLLIADIFGKYLEEVAPLKPLPKDSVKSFRLLRRLTAKLTLANLNASDLTQWAKDNCPKASPPSVARYLNRITTVLRVAEGLWDVQVPWDEFRKAKATMKRLGAIAECRDRTRRVEGDELDRVLREIRSAIPVKDIIRVAVATAMRSAEITSLRWADLDESKRTVWVRDRKHPTAKRGNDWEVPLLNGSFDIIMRQPRGSDRIFPYKSASVEAAYRRARKLAGVKGLRFHDLRREGITRLFESGYGIAEVSLVSGHRSWNNLRRYTKLSPESLHDGPISKK